MWSEEFGATRAIALLLVVNEMRFNVCVCVCVVLGVLHFSFSYTTFVSPCAYVCVECLV